MTDQTQKKMIDEIKYYMNTAAAYGVIMMILVFTLSAGVFYFIGDENFMANALRLSVCIDAAFLFITVITIWMQYTVYMVRYHDTEEQFVEVWDKSVRRKRYFLRMNDGHGTEYRVSKHVYDSVVRYDTVFILEKDGKTFVGIEDNTAHIPYKDFFKKKG